MLTVMSPEYVIHPSLPLF